ncbi:divergent polysaccharide deacetylase family protein [Paenibacillus sedimenti]|uniref:Divergent polysaccharide deacetylase family protein n=1 Tax=Paenibacillus sedimenti TaxID=2770274 RepID=A0A926KSX9_9BACL|nr:divergent polysaccharide deacetylase family protein [Paenibacillus sedimenti]MBD0381653.1 divergent polysaccharide deacetylase family protein [Paenibacillus sedimenti]
MHRKKMNPLRKFTLSLILCGALLLVIPYQAGALSEPVPASEETVERSKQVAIVIDDFGNNMDGTAEMLSLPIPLTVAVMPFLPSTKKDAQLAHEKGYEVLLHLPMEPQRGKKSWLGPGAITTDLSNDEIRKRVLAAIADVPYAIGINNHMGSKATADERVMKIIVEVCKDKGLMILDSRTSHKSLIGKLAEQMEVPYTENLLFFDDLYTYNHISKQMVKFKKLIHDKETSIAIGHVGPPGKKTAQVIKEAIPSIQKEATFVSISKTMKIPTVKMGESLQNIAPRK